MNFGKLFGIFIFHLFWTSQAISDDPKVSDLFSSKIKPLLKQHCYACHSAEATKLKGGLKLDSRSAMLKGGDTGPAVVPGRVAESLLIQAIKHRNGLEMPPKKPRLSDGIVQEIETWINLGAIIPGESNVNASEDSSIQEAKKHWAFQPITKPALPVVKSKKWVRNPLDAFILAKLEAKGWSPAPESSRSDWIRRVTFDLTGLPPEPREVATFLSDATANAYERVVDRLLESPRYGERWAQHWLDVVRFAETEGYEYDRAIPDAWRFRDYVINSFQRDKPFDRFITEQIAGDEISPGDEECRVASAFHRLGPVRRNAGNPEIALSRNEVLTERTDIIGTAFLGLTVGCARCHNHKLEPITQKDYYRLQAYLGATEENNISLATDAEQKAWNAKSNLIAEAVAKLKAKVRSAKGPEREKLATELEDLEDSQPLSLPTIPATRNDMKTRTIIHVLKRGVWENKGEPVGPRPLSVLVNDESKELQGDIDKPRTKLAEWLTSSTQPLTARVLANRIWALHFGTGIVKTINDFGIKGERPSHPELLDWLASSLMANGWHIKALHKQIVLSATYRQSVVSPDASDKKILDPENRLLWHFARRRLTAEEIRDAMLFVSGKLNPKSGGPSVMIPVEPDMIKLLYKPSQWQPAKDPSEYDRRTIYLYAKRNLRLPFMETFDAPALLSSCAKRESSTHAPQALELLNGPLANSLAESFAQRLLRERNTTDERVDLAFELALARLPNAAEKQFAIDFLRDESLKEFTLAVFNMNGFLYVP